MKFTKKDERLIEVLLGYGSRPLDRWGDLNGISKKLRFPKKVKDVQKATKKRLENLEKKLESIGVELKRTKSKIHNSTVYSIDLKEIKGKLKDLPIFNKPKRKTTFLYLGELGFGTTGYDERAAKGLNYFLKYNDEGKKTLKKTLLDSLDSVVLEGGLIPFVPEWYTVTAAHSMRLLGKKVPKDVSNLSEQEAEEEKRKALEESEISPVLKDFYKKHIKGKILTKSDAINVARQQLETILGKEFSKPIHYAYGEEDQTMLKQLEEINIADLMEKSEAIAKTESKLQRNMEELIKLESEYAKEQRILETMKIWLNRATPLKRENFNEHIDDFVKKYEKDFNSLDKEYTGLGTNIKQFLKACKSEEDILQRLEKTKVNFKSKREDTKELESQIKDMHNRMNAIKREQESGFFKITKRVQITPEQEALLWMVVSGEYATKLKDAWKKSNLYLHPERRADVVVNRRLVRLEHSMNLRSNAPLKTTLKKQKEESNLAHKRGQPVPDVYVSSHGSGGFRAQPKPKFPENTTEGEYREQPEIEMLVKLPTFHSGGNLEYLIRNDVVKNWMVKRFDGPYAAGAVIHTIESDESHHIKFISTKDLVELGRVAELIEIKQKLLKDKETPAEKKAKLEKEIEKLKTSFSAEEKLKFHSLVDAHIGSPTHIGRPSNYMYIDAVVKHEEKELPNVLILSEDAHGSLKKTFSSDKQQLGLTRPELEKTIDNINNDSSLSLEEKVDLLSTLIKMNDALNVVPVMSIQYKTFDKKIAPYAKKVIESGGIVIIASGNHPQKSTEGDIDEAIDLSRAFNDQEIKNVYVLSGIAQKFGTGTVRLSKFNDDRRLYVTHKFNRASDEVLGAINQITKMGSDVAMAFGADVHKPGIGFADGTAIIIGAGLQSWNKYLDVTGSQGSLRGIVEAYLSKNPKLGQYFEAKFVLDPTLESKYMKKEIELEKKLVEKYIPRNK